jgi:hypothetical protein
MAPVSTCNQFEIPNVQGLGHLLRPFYAICAACFFLRQYRPQVCRGIKYWIKTPDAVKVVRLVMLRATVHWVANAVYYHHLFLPSWPHLASITSEGTGDYFFVRAKSISGPREGLLRSGPELLAQSGQPSVQSLVIWVALHSNPLDHFLWYPPPGWFHSPPQTERQILLQVIHDVDQFIIAQSPALARYQVLPRH